ncbi:MAG: ferritin-like domain-containing protein [Actinomycetota bacterium]|nr:ferritin-like domain-containing protein [Actinomycetota bacterium]MDQ2957661.1 ferritin-like domain-containing protein [Actinomycetota bacterium]
MTSSQPGDPIAAGLQRVLAAQHACVYGYPLIGVTLTDAGQVEQARSLEATHRLSRDSLMAELVARKVVPVAADAQYRPAAPVTDAASAQRWALALESDCAAGYRYLLMATTQLTGSQGTVRHEALTGLTSSALSALGWRSLLSPTGRTVPFPGI